MNPAIAKAVILAGSVAMIVIRAPHGQRSRQVKVVKSRKGALERVLLTVAWAAFFLALLWALSPLLAFADYPLHAVPLVVGSLGLVLGLWLLYRSHADLGTNWSLTLELREGHTLVTRGIYERVRHPMYLAFLVYALGQALALPNWIAGPAYLVAMATLFALRVGPEERMLREEFGPQYDAYVARSKRLIPGVW